MPNSQLDRFRQAAGETIRLNLQTLNGAGPPALIEREGADEGPMTAVGAGLEAHRAALNELGKEMLHGAGPMVRGLAKTALAGPGAVLDLAEIMHAKDKWRAAATTAGGVGGGVLGEAIAGPPGAAIGYVAGRKFADYMYDHPEARRRAWETPYPPSMPIL